MNLYPINEITEAIDEIDRCATCSSETCIECPTPLDFAKLAEMLEELIYVREQSNL